MMSGKGQGKVKPCQGVRKKRGRKILLRPSILVMLLEEPSHGYQLAERLINRGIIPDHLDSSVIYRELRELDQRGWIDSHWDDNSKGPRRRVYQINQQGRNCLKEWITALERVEENIASLLGRYRDLTANQ